MPSNSHRSQLAARTSPLPPDPARPGPPWIAAAHHKTRIDLQWLLVCTVMLAAATAYFGSRALIAVALTTVSTVVAYTLFACVLATLRGRRTRFISPYAIWIGMLLGLGMPVAENLALPIIAGLLLGAVAHVVGRSHRVRVHPVALMLVILFLAPNLLPDSPSRVSLSRAITQTVPAVLGPGRLFIGDVNDAPDQLNTEPWLSHHDADHDALRRTDPQLVILDERQAILSRPDRLRYLLSSGMLVRFEELAIGAAPGPVGATSPVLIILLGLYLMYLRLASWRSAVLAFAAALAVALLWPVQPNGGAWQPTALALVQLGPAGAVTFVSYLLFASPLCFIVFLLAPSVDPMSRRGRTVYALLNGGLVVAALLIFAAPEAAFIAPVLTGLISRPLDALHKSPFVS